LRIWVQGRQFPWEEDFWDGNWMLITAICRLRDSEVRAQGPYLHLGDILRWVQECERLMTTRRDTVTLWAVEPELNMRLNASNEGIRAEIRLSPDLAQQEHLFRSEVGWSELEAFLAGLRGVLEAYPIRQPHRLQQASPLACL
jgi:hypothetical protein